jgi:hypothetical protein
LHKTRLLETSPAGLIDRPDLQRDGWAFGRVDGWLHLHSWGQHFSFKSFNKDNLAIGLQPLTEKGRHSRGLTSITALLLFVQIVT